jgi:uncharacterized protein
MPEAPRLPAPQRAFHLMVKPAGAICNLDCAYCYFLSKELLFPGSRFRMARETLERSIEQYLAAQPPGDVTFAWQGGEPTLLGLPFFELAVELQRQHRPPGRRIVNTIQTNGTRLDDDWCRFFRRHEFLVGISLDGPRDLHDAYRVDKAGHGSFDRVMAGVELLVRHGVEFNVLTAVHAANQDEPLRVYRFLRDEVGARFVQFIPIVERDDETGFQEGRAVTARSVDALAYGAFMNAIFDEWVRRDVGGVFVQLFDVTLGNHVGAPGGLCVFEETCGHALALEHTGDVYACDHFVEPAHHLGNLHELPLSRMIDDERQIAFGLAKRDTLPRQCRSCDVRSLCHGGCPKDRVRHTADGEDGLNYLCEGYDAFFTHTRPLMRFMAEELRHHRPPANVMAHAARRAAPAGPTGAASAPWVMAGEPGTSMSRNAPCGCGSGRKHKHCCGRG